MGLRLRTKAPILRLVGNEVSVCDECSDVVKELIYALVQLVPMGKVTTYKDIAELVGVNARVVGRVLSANKEPIAIPCHRVVRSDGSLGGYTLGGKKMCVQFKMSILRLEGVEVHNGRVPREYIVSLRNFLVKYAN